MTILEVVKSRLGEPGPTGEFPYPFCKRHGAVGALAVRRDPPAWQCSQCGDGGDVVKFLSLHDRISRPQAEELLAARVNLDAVFAKPEPKPSQITEMMRGKFNVTAKLEKASTS